MIIENSIQKSVINQIYNSKINSITDFINNIETVALLKTEKVKGWGDKLISTIRSGKDLFEFQFTLKQFQSTIEFLKNKYIRLEFDSTLKTHYFVENYNQCLWHNFLFSNEYR